MGTFAQASRNNISEITKVMIASFSTYPFVERFLKSAFAYETQRLHFLEKMCNVLVRALMRKSVCLVEKRNHEIRALCVLSPIKNMKVSIWDLIVSGAIRILPYLFRKDIFQFIKFYLMDAALADLNFADSDKVWYVHLFAVDSNHQGKRIGSEMISNYVVPYVKQHHGTGIILSTNTETALKFYKKNGFTTIAHNKISNMGESFDQWSLLHVIN